jgi:hypothetical protein
MAQRPRLARIHADLAAILEKHSDDPAANAGVTPIVAMHSSTVGEPVAEFDETAAQPMLDPRVAAAWQEYKRTRPILEALDGVGADAARRIPADAKAALARRLHALSKSGVMLPVEHRRAFAFHLAALEGARRASDAAQAKLPRIASIRSSPWRSSTDAPR